MIVNKVRTKILVDTLLKLPPFLNINFANGKAFHNLAIKVKNFLT